MIIDDAYIENWRKRDAAQFAAMLERARARQPQPAPAVQNTVGMYDAPPAEKRTARIYDTPPATPLTQRGPLAPLGDLLLVVAQCLRQIARAR